MLKKFIKSAFWGVATLVSLTTHGQTSGTVYFSSGSPTQLYRLSDPGTPGVTATAVGSAATTYNAMGYNNVDGYLYAVSSNGVVVRINANTGVVTNLNISLPSGNNYAAGEVVDNMMYVTNMNGSETTRTLFRINLSTGTYSSSVIGAPIADLAYYGGFLYGYNGQTGEIYKITPGTGAKTVVGSGFGTGGAAALWSDGTGIIYFDGRAIYNANTNTTMPDAAVGTGANVAGSGSGTDDGTWSPASIPFTNGGIIGYSQNNCDPFDPALINSIANASGGSGTIEYRWWANGAIIPGATAATYDPGPISVTTNYQREARRGNTAWVASNAVTMTITACNTSLTDGGTIGVGQNSCSAFDPANIAAITLPSGGTGPAPIEYRWWANGVIIPGATAATYDPGTVSVTTNYQREARRGSTTAWVASNVVTMTINSAPAVVISSSGGTPQCYVGSLVLTATGANTYTWSTGSATDTTAVSPPASTTYTVTGIDANGCTATASIVVSPAIKGNITSNPVTSSSDRVCAGTPVTLTATGGDTYTWVGSGVTTDTNTVIATPGNDVYEVVVVGKSGCSIVDTAKIIVYGKGCNDPNALVSTFSGNVRFDNTGDINIYPNPVEGQLTIEGLTGDESVIIYNALGQKLTEVRAVKVKSIISFEQMNRGNYLVVVVKDGKRIKSQHIVKK